MKTLVGAAGVFAVSSLPWGGLAAKELVGLGEKDINIKNYRCKSISNW